MTNVINLPQDQSGFGPILEQLVTELQANKERKRQQSGLLLNMLMQYGGQVPEEQMTGIERDLGFRKGPIMESIMGKIGLPQPQGSILRNIAQPTYPTTTTETLEGTTVSPGPAQFKFPSKEEREVGTFEKKAAIEEAAKLPYRREELVHKATLAENALVVKQNQLDIQKQHYEALKDIQDQRILLAEQQGRDKTYIAELRDATTTYLGELKDKISNLHIEVEKGKLEAIKTKAEAAVTAAGKKGEMTEKENITAFENQMVAKGYMEVNPKTKAKTWTQLSREHETADLEKTAKQYGFKVDWTERTSAVLGTKTWIPTIDYSTARGEVKTEKTVKSNANSLIDQANEAIKKGADPVAVKKRLKELGVEVR